MTLGVLKQFIVTKMNIDFNIYLVVWTNVMAGFTCVVLDDGVGENWGLVGWGLISLITLLPVMKLGLVF